MTTLTGHSFIGSKRGVDSLATFQAVNPKTSSPLEPLFFEATDAEINEAARLAQEAFQVYRLVSGSLRAEFLEAIAKEIEALGEALLERANLETALPLPRLTGERGRTCGQLRMFAALVRDGSWADIRIELAEPDRQPTPKPDLRRMLIGIGPVAVFGASNFPFAFSTAGGDTASALAAGCPVIVKAHPAHPGTSEMAAGAILRAATATGMPEGVFSMVFGGPAVGQSLVGHPAIQAVGFTGSARAGRALFDLANSRPNPIPVFAEMGSVNPIFILPGALADRGHEIANGYAASLSLGVGQFCTNPGVVIGISNSRRMARADVPADETTFEVFVQDVANRLAESPPASMLTPQIWKSYSDGVQHLATHPEVRAVHQGHASPGDSSASPSLLLTDGRAVLEQPDLLIEVFGPAGLVVSCDSIEQMIEIVRSLEGQLTATIHVGSGDEGLAKQLLSILAQKAGRLLVNGFPTGVEVCSAMQHGGPYPASTDSRFTSVGTAAIFRFARPVVFQDVPQNLLPPELRD